MLFWGFEGFFCLFGVFCEVFYFGKRGCKICQTDALFPLKATPTSTRHSHQSVCPFLVQSPFRTSQLPVPGPGRMSCPYFINGKNQDIWALIYVFFTIPHHIRLQLLPADLGKTSKKMGFPLNATPSSLHSQASIHWSNLIQDTPKPSLWCRATKCSFEHRTVICQDKALGYAVHDCAVAHTHHPGVPASGRTSAVPDPSRCPGAGPHGSPGTWWHRWALGPSTGSWLLSLLGSRIVSGEQGLPPQSSVSWHILRCRKRQIYTHSCPDPLFPLEQECQRSNSSF